MDLVWASAKEALAMSDDPLLPLLKAIKLVTGTRPHCSTAIRWIRDGVRVGDVRIRLESCRVGSRHFARASAIRAFVDATTEGLNHVAPLLPTNKTMRSVSQRQKAIEQANAKLDELGI